MYAFLCTRVPMDGRLLGCGECSRFNSIEIEQIKQNKKHKILSLAQSYEVWMKAKKFVDGFYVYKMSGK